MCHHQLRDANEAQNSHCRQVRARARTRTRTAIKATRATATTVTAVTDVAAAGTETGDTLAALTTCQNPGW